MTNDSKHHVKDYLQMDMENNNLKEMDSQLISQHSVLYTDKKKLYLLSEAIFFIVFDCGLYQVAVTQRCVLTGNERSHVRLLYSAAINGTFEIASDLTDPSYYNGRYYSNKPQGFVFALMPT